MSALSVPPSVRKVLGDKASIDLITWLNESSLRRIESKLSDIEIKLDTLIIKNDIK